MFIESISILPEAICFMSIINKDVCSHSPGLGPVRGTHGKER